MKAAPEVRSYRWRLLNASAVGRNAAPLHYFLSASAPLTPNEARSIVKTMPVDDIRRTVAQSYDQIADRYLERFGQSSVRAAKLAELVKLLPASAAVLDLGCGCGIPAAQQLVAKGFRVTGIDSSIGQIERARSNVPTANFVHADMTSVTLPDEAFDAVYAFYSITHVPKNEHPELVRRIAKWLRPGGCFVASFGTSEGDWSGEWLGAPMFFSAHDPELTKQTIARAGLCLERAELVEQDNEPVKFLWIAARKSL